MPAFNSASTLLDSARSVLDQTVRTLELIIVNDGSRDATRTIAEEISKGDPRVKLVARSRRGGPAAARNSGIEVARGRYLAFCDADDLWMPQKLERQLELADRSGAPLVYSSYHRVDADFSGPASGFRSEGRVVQVPTELTYEQLLRRNVIGCLTAVVDREQAGPVAMPNLSGAEDYALWLRILRDGAVAVGVDEPLALYRAEQPGSHSAARWRAVQAVWRVLREEEGLAMRDAIRHLATDAVAALRKSRI
jgi:hypothetical protein